MEIKKDSGNEKILLVLQDSNRSMTVKSLAEKTGLAYKNIHRNISQLFNFGYITLQTIQEGRCRNKYIGLAPNGVAYNPTEVIEEHTTITTQPYVYLGESTSKLDEVEVNTIRLGIGFYKDYARGLGIPDYSRLSLAQLKLKIGMRLIYQSGKVDVLRMLNTIHNIEE